MMPAYTILLEVLVKPPEVNFSQSHNNLLFKVVLLTIFFVLLLDGMSLCHLEEPRYSLAHAKKLTMDE